MNALRKVLRGVTHANEWLGRAVLAWLVLAMFVLLFMEVNMRYLFGSPTVWTGELTQMLFGAYAILAGAYIMTQRAHVNVDIFYARFPRRVRAAVDVLTSALFFAFVLVLVTEGYSMAEDSISRWETSRSAWNPPVWPVKLAIPVGAGLLLLQGIVKLIHDILILFNLEGSEPLFPEQAGEDQL
ncbi:TRAP transporter small permease subunit [Aquisalimonas asiatica]|uniref:TRAP transporter small permease protein n=1 Tax=Aquisalimonas asiatica TaxID=406100 RepID=A0A1H8RRF0_9GAMM|nr:TRAP transporter small permease subunit [Aquisalimonas asiatica]SEO68754.1 TRAP-type mannitol/chloroaromatic compound transport system, small permease component [Aquisalimonas asiatica]